MIPHPDPPLRAGEVRLRPWQVDDAPALVAAWDDDAIRCWTAVPHERGLAAAQRWIGGDRARRERHLSLDLVVDVAGDVAGEVGLTDFDAHGRAEIGWWTAASHRGNGVATTAVALLAGWALEALGLGVVVARCAAANAASVAVARAAGFETTDDTPEVTVLERRAAR